MSYVSYPVRFCYDNVAAASGTTVSATSVTTSLPWTNTQNPQITRVGQSGTTNDYYINWVFDSATAIQQFILRNHNFPSGTTLTLEADTNPTFTTPAVQTGLTLTTNPDPIMYDWASAQTYQYWRLHVQTTGATVTSVGHVFLGPYTEVDFPARSTAWDVVDPSISSNAYGGAHTSYYKPSYRTVEFTTSPVDQADRRALTTMYETVGTHKPLYIVFDPFNFRDTDGYHRLTLFCRMTNNRLRFPHIGQDWSEGVAITVDEIRE